MTKDEIIAMVATAEREACAQADEMNQWDDLGEDEKIEWAVKCAHRIKGDSHW